MSKKSRFIITSLRDTKFKTDLSILADLPMNTPLIFARKKTLNGYRYGFKRVGARLATATVSEWLGE